MRKLTYAIALSTLLLAGCSQDEGIMESKGELVTLNYKVSLGKDVQSRADASDLAVNKLLCVVFENGAEIKRDIVNVENGQATYTPQLFTSIEYNIVFWAYYDNTPDDETVNSCFDMTSATAIAANTSYGGEDFTEDKHKDAYTNVHTVILSQQGQTPSVILTRPFAQVNIISSMADYNKAVSYGRTPTTCKVEISGYANQFNALTGEWTGIGSTTLTSTVVAGDEDCLYASEYVFGNGTATSCKVTVYDNDVNGPKPIYSADVPSLPLGENQRTNLTSENLLTGGGVTYTITVDKGFHGDEHDKVI